MEGLKICSLSSGYTGGHIFYTLWECDKLQSLPFPTQIKKDFPLYIFYIHCVKTIIKDSNHLALMTAVVLFQRGTNRILQKFPTTSEGTFNPICCLLNKGLKRKRKH